MKYKCKAIIWDLDGTLLNTIEDLTDSVNHVMKEYGYPERSIAEIMQFVGNGIERLMELATPQGKGNPAFTEIFQSFKTCYTSHCNLKTAPYKGIPELLEKFKESGFKQAVVSNKNQAAVEELVNIYFAEYMDVSIGQSEALQKKPSSDMVMAALDKMGISKEDAIYIGDSEVDVQTAKNCSMDGIAVSWGFRSREELLEAGATCILDNTKTLLKTIYFG